MLFRRLVSRLLAVSASAQVVHHCHTKEQAYNTCTLSQRKGVIPSLSLP